MEKCYLCPNNCGVDRETSIGVCGVKNKLKIAKYGKFMLEEPCISGVNGSGAIFFCGCPLKCVFCQNYAVSRNKIGSEITPLRLADIFKELEDLGCHNINLVNPTHYLRQIAEAAEIYKPHIPVVYNTHGYEKAEMLKVADNFVDVYLPDLKYYGEEVAKRYSGRSDYFAVASQAVKHMSKKPLVMENGIMKSGCMVRHLILPMNTADSIKIFNWFDENLPQETYFSLMSQYTPFGEIENFPELKRPITKREYQRVLDCVMESGRKNVYVQDLTSSGEVYIPEWDL